MSYVRHTLLSLLLLHPALLIAQESDLSYVRDVPGLGTSSLFPNSIIAMPDGGSVVVFTTWIPMENMVWSRRTIGIMRLTSGGVIEWNKVIRLVEPGEVSHQYVADTDHFGNVIIGANHRLDGPGTMNRSQILTISPHGELIDIISEEELPYDLPELIERCDDGFIGVDSRDEYAQEIHACIYRTDWTYDPSWDDYAFQIQWTDRGLELLGSVWFAWLDETKNTLRLSDMAIDSQGGIAIAASVQSDRSTDSIAPVIIRFDSTGNLIAARKITHDRNVSIGSIAFLSDGRLLVVGSIHFCDTSEAPFLTILNPDLSIDSRSDSYLYELNGTPGEITRLSDGGFLVQLTSGWRRYHTSKQHANGYLHVASDGRELAAVQFGSLPARTTLEERGKPVDSISRGQAFRPSGQICMMMFAADHRGGGLFVGYDSLLVPFFLRYHPSSDPRCLIDNHPIRSRQFELATEDVTEKLLTGLSRTVTHRTYPEPLMTLIDRPVELVRFCAQANE